MNSHRPGRPFGRGKLVGAIIVPLLSLVAAAGGVPGAARVLAQDRKPAVRMAPGDMDACGAPALPKNDLERACLRGRVRTLTGESRAARAQGGFEGDLYSIVKTSFDERGNRTLTEISDGGNGPGPVGKVWRRLVYGYDAEGRMTEQKSYKDGQDAPTGALIYSYDERGNRVKIDSTRTEPDARMVQKFSYDAEGHEVGHSLSRLTPGGWQTSRSRNVVTSEGGLQRVRTYSPEGALRGRVETLRNEHGRPLGEEMYVADARGEERLQWKVTYRYDERGLLAEVVYHKADEWLGARAVYEYDERGNVTSLTRYNADGTFAASAHCEYQYDAAGNWVRRVKSYRSSEAAAPQPSGVDRRYLTYY